MTGRLAPTLAESLAAAQDWWREAGVDFTYRDEPVAWLADDEPAASPARSPVAPAPQAAPPPPKIGGDRAGWPRDLAGFARWWLEEPGLDAGGINPRVAPRAVAGAEVLMLVPMPEDGDSETLLAGPQGRLLAAFAQAAGLAPDAVALAAALPRHAALPDWAALAARGLGDVLLHLLELIGPKRVIVFGAGVLPLLRHGLTQGAPAVSELSIQGRAVPLLATYAPEHLLTGARQREGFWQRWLEWTDGTSA